MSLRSAIGLLLLASTLALMGCAHRVAINTDPMGAQVHRGRKSIGATPIEVVIVSIPFSRPKVRLTMPGYRTMVVELRKDKKPMRRFWELITLRPRRALALVPNASHEVLLVEVHGPSGTWEPEEVPD